MTQTVRKVVLLERIRKRYAARGKSCCRTCGVPIKAGETVYVTFNGHNRKLDHEACYLSRAIQI